MNIHNSILIVDDNPDACITTAKILRVFNHRSQIALNGPDALEMLERNPCALAIIDYEMPGMNGVELFERMLKVQPDIKGLFLTGHTTVDVVFPAIAAGITRILSKPVNLEELMPLVDELVREVG